MSQDAAAPSDTALTYTEAKARLQAVWRVGTLGGHILGRFSSDPAERVPLLTVETALAVLYPGAT